MIEGVGISINRAVSEGYKPGNYTVHTPHSCIIVCVCVCVVVECPLLKICLHNSEEVVYRVELKMYPL